MDKSTKIMTTIVHSENEYAFHFPCTENVIRYDVKHMKFQSIVNGKVEKTIYMYMTFEDFKFLYKGVLSKFFKRPVFLN